MRSKTYTEEEVAAEEEKIGGRLPDELRRRFLEGIPDEIVLKDGDSGHPIHTWGPSTTKTDKKGREYPTPGLAKETSEVAVDGESLLDDDVLVAWGDDGSGNLAVVLRDGSLALWELHGGEIRPVEVIWEPSDEILDRIEAGEPI